MHAMLPASMSTSLRQCSIAPVGRPACSQPCCRRRVSCWCSPRPAACPLGGMPTLDPPPNKDEGGGVLDRPDLDLSKGGIAPKTEDNYGAGETSSRGVTGGGNYRVMLIDNDKHTEKLVVSTLTTVVGSDENHAKNVFATSKQLGQAMILSCLKEHAEHYAEQIKRKGVSATIEPDSTTL